MRELRSIRHGFQHGQNVRAASTMAAEARDVAFNGSQIDPQAALRDGSAQVADSLDHARIPWAFEQNRIARAEKGQEAAFQLVWIGDGDHLAAWPGRFVTVGCSAEIAAADQKKMCESARACLSAYLAMFAIRACAQLSHPREGKNLAAAGIAERG